MAEAYGKLTGKPGICLVTRGPGACHASIGVHTAFQDSTPMILLVGQVGRDMMDREAFQEIDYRQMFGPVAKWAAQIDSAARIPEYMSRGLSRRDLRPAGPGGAGAARGHADRDAPTVADAAPYVPRAGQAAPADIARLREMLASAEQPLLLVGGSGWTDAACARHPGLRRGQRPAGRVLVPPPGRVRQSHPHAMWAISALGPAGADPARQGSRPAARRRRAARRDDDPGLHDHGLARAAADAHPCPPRRRRVRPRLPADAGDPSASAAFAPAAAAMAAGRRRANGAHWTRGRARRLSRRTRAAAL